MANVKDFNREQDLITQHEVVYDFVSRVAIGKDWLDPQRQDLIFENKLNFKNILRQIAKCLPTTMYNNLQTIATNYVNVPVGATSVSCDVYGGNMILAISERTGQDLTDCFEQSGWLSYEQDENGDPVAHIGYIMNLDVPYTNSDTIRFYSIANSII